MVLTWVIVFKVILLSITPNTPHQINKNMSLRRRDHPVPSCDDHLDRHFIIFLNPGFLSFGAKPYVRRKIQVFVIHFVLSALCFSFSANAPWACPCLSGEVFCLIAFVSCLIAPSCSLSFPSFTQSPLVYLFHLVIGHFRSCM